MVNLAFSSGFKKELRKIKHKGRIEAVRKLLTKIKNNPALGKPMRFQRVGTRELNIKPYRLSYCYLEDRNLVVILDMYHKDEQ